MADVVDATSIILLLEKMILCILTNLGWKGFKVADTRSEKRRPGERMNWLIYIGGFYLGVAGISIVTELAKLFGAIKGVTITIHAFYTYLAWTMIWIWICWRFIR